MDEVTQQACEGERGTAAGRRWVRGVARGILIGVVVALVVSYVAIKARWWKAPYPSWSKRICWWIGGREEAYNFGVVVPGRAFRSGRPDKRWYRYIYKKYGVRHIVRLNGPDDPVPFPPDDLNMKVTVLSWSAADPPPREELKEVLEILDGPEPVLVHCWAGADRTGYAVAAYRILRQGWTIEQAFEEMSDFWHDNRRNHLLQDDLHKLAAAGRDP